MSVSRLSISVPPHVEYAIRAAAEQSAIADGLAGVAEFEADDGVLTDAEQAEEHQALIDADVIPPQRAAG